MLAEHDEEENKKAREAAKKYAKEESKDTVHYSNIDTYSWEDTGKFIKVYILNLEGIKDLPEGQATCDFTPNSFELKIKGLNGKNLRLAVPELFGEISDRVSKLKFKSSSVTIAMRKANFDQIWHDLKEGGATGPDPGMGGMPPGGMFGGGMPGMGGEGGMPGMGAMGGEEGGMPDMGGPGGQADMMKAMMEMAQKNPEMAEQLAKGMAGGQEGGE